MKAKAMLDLAHNGNHEAVPKAWRDVPNLTGDYDCDATIEHRNNPSLPDRLWMYLKRPRHAYAIRTGYGGYGDND
jgi:hypothetical protein